MFQKYWELKAILNICSFSEISLKNNFLMCPLKKSFQSPFHFSKGRREKIFILRVFSHKKIFVIAKSERMILSLDRETDLSLVYGIFLA